MAGTISTLGYSVSLTVVLTGLALVIGLAVTMMFLLTVGWSVYRAVMDSRRQRIRDELQDQFLDRVFAAEADWAQWVDGLSKIERGVAESLLEEYLRELSGQYRERLQNLGDELGIVERSERRLQRSGEYERLSALTWLTLLDRPEPVYRTDFTPRTPRERAAVARLRYESSDFADPNEGIELLLEDVTTEFTIFGQDTLYRIAVENPRGLFEIADSNYRTWSNSLLIQVLAVCRHLGTNVTTEHLFWLISVTEHENEMVREMAPLALENLGWHSDLRDEQFSRRLVNDPSPRVRASVYRMLANWGDDEAMAALVAGLQTEGNPRARLAGTDALVRHGGVSQTDLPASLATAWAWSSEHADYDRIARNRGKQLSN